MPVVNPGVYAAPGQAAARVAVRNMQTELMVRFGLGPEVSRPSGCASAPRPVWRAALYESAFAFDRVGALQDGEG